MSLHTSFDAFLLDLDGTVWEGGQALPGAVESLNAAHAQLVYITNNASRGPAVVARMLSDIGLPTARNQVLTSAEAAIEIVAGSVEKQAKVLVLGSESFKELAREAGLKVVDSADDDPEAVLHGHNPATGWAELSEATLAIRNGASYFASNLDTTLPTERGLCVGNGSMVAAVVSATGVHPESAGKPEPAMFHSAVRRFNATAPLAIGDRLNTDIAGAVAAQIPVLHVLTGVSRHWALLRAHADERPTYIAEDLRGLNEKPTSLIPAAQSGFEAVRDGDDIVLRGGKPDTSGVDALRTVLSVAWELDSSFEGSVRPEGDVAAAAMDTWV
ncbi:HAD-IIA family hydrolase [Corynebacterium gerontici]|uniref:Putative hydrolase YutF n=1 Tax=Corynebacterium gerontici TaxID=2079234 RepID=A0A3G6J073_9CORY|nr:HAD-IIA family hydrolase [Corynebacterium gerontici]AZA11352.1 putative hydrolase YutF [Corynebacterium gerontici]